MKTSSTHWKDRLKAAGSLLVAVMVAGVALLPSTPARAANPACPKGAILNVVAHADDDLLFLSPNMIADIDAGRCVRTVVLTAGDVGGDLAYMRDREVGLRKAYAKMAKVTNIWTKSNAGVAGHPINLFTLNSKKTVSLAFVRLPDGAEDGAGFPSVGSESLQKLWEGSIASIQAVDGTSSYSKATLTGTLTTIMNSYQPTQVRTQDYVGHFGDGDHSDHYAAAQFARAAHLQYGGVHTFTGYEGYGTMDRPQNVFGTELTRKSNAFYAYATRDDGVCGSEIECRGGAFEAWLKRQYAVGSENGGGGTPAPTPTPTPSPSPTGNIAGQASVTASSENTADGQVAAKAIDGFATGYPVDYTKEWVTAGGHAGSWLKLTWSTPRTISRVVLYDRPNPVDQITGATITFSDGTSITLGPLANDGGATTFTFPAKTVTSLQLNVTAISDGTANVGLAEIEVY